MEGVLMAIDVRTGKSIFCICVSCGDATLESIDGNCLKCEQEQALTRELMWADMLARQRKINDDHDKVVELSRAEYSVKP